MQVLCKFYAKYGIPTRNINYLSFCFMQFLCNSVRLSFLGGVARSLSERGFGGLSLASLWSLGHLH